MIEWLFLSTLFFLPDVVEAAPGADTSGIRDLHGPLAIGSLPPFTFTALVILIAGIVLIVSVLFQKKSPTNLVVMVPEVSRDDLEVLSYAYRRGEIPVVQVFDRLAELLRSVLTTGDPQALTDEELLIAARQTCSPDALAVAASLLELCERVRYGAFLPDEVCVMRALAEAHQVLQPAADV